MSKPIVNEAVTISMRLLFDGQNVIVETPWARSIMPAEKLVNMVLAYGSLCWKNPVVSPENDTHLS